MSSSYDPTHSAPPNERTPLISSNRESSHHVQNAGVPEPWVETFVNQLHVQDFSNAQKIPVDSLCPHAITVPTSRTAFALIVLTQLHKALSSGSRKNASDHLGELWNQEMRDRQRLEVVKGEIQFYWNAFLQTEPPTLEVDRVLWISFPLNQTSQRIRLVDLIGDESVPEILLTHPILLLSLTRTWKLGPAAREERTTAFGRVSQRLRALSTPRVLHLLDLLLHTAFLVLLIWYIFSPPTTPLDEDAGQLTPGVREILMVVYSFSEVCRAKSTFIPAAITFLSLASHLPSVPLANDVAFGGLLVALTLNVLQLHVPVHPSPIFLLPPSDVLPLSTLVWHGMSRIFLPVMAFFLPSILIFFFLLSMSLSNILSTIPFLTNNCGPSPLETRTAFAFLSAILLGIMICSIIMLILAYPFHSSANTSSTWDRYSHSVGLNARRAFVRVVIAYSGRKIFPPPFNLLYLLVAAPKAIFRLVGAERPLVWFDKLQDILWHLTILPCSLVVGSFFCWGLLV